MAHPERVAALIEQHVGRPSTRTLNIARKLREAGILPAGGPGTAPDYTRADAIKLLLGACTAATLENVPDTTKALLDATPGGADVSGAPLTVPRTAEIQLAILASMAADGDDLDELLIEIVIDWPELALCWSDGSVQRFQKAGTVSNHPLGKARMAARIPGPAYAAFIRSIK